MPLYSNPDVLGADLLRLVNSPIGADIQLIIGQEQVKMHAHSLILQARSTYFARALDNDWKEATQRIIHKPNISPVVFERILHYIYGGRLMVEDDLVMDLIKAADELCMEDLLHGCERHALSTICRDNVLQLVQAASLHNLAQLKTECLDFIASNIDHIKRGKTILMLDADILKDILSMDQLDLEELEIWKIAVRWAYYHQGLDWAHCPLVEFPKGSGCVLVQILAEDGAQAVSSSSSHDEDTNSPDGSDNGFGGDARVPIRGTNIRLERLQDDDGFGAPTQSVFQQATHHNIVKLPINVHEDLQALIAPLLPSIRFMRIPSLEFLRLIEGTGLLPVHLCAKVYRYHSVPSMADPYQTSLRRRMAFSTILNKEQKEIVLGWLQTAIVDSQTLASSNGAWHRRSVYSSSPPIPGNGSSIAVSSGTPASSPIRASFFSSTDMSTSSPPYSPPRPGIMASSPPGRGIGIRRSGSGTTIANNIQPTYSSFAQMQQSHVPPTSTTPTPLPNLILQYRATRDGFDATNFHMTCDQRGPTLTVVRADNGAVFGGYNSSSWSSHPSGVYSTSRVNFLFTLKSRDQPHRENVRFEVKGDGNAAAYNKADFGPTFGVGHDLFLSSNCNLTCQSSSTMPSSYSGPGASTASMAGSFYFRVQEYEVFLVQATWCTAARSSLWFKASWNDRYLHHEQIEILSRFSTLDELEIQPAEGLSRLSRRRKALEEALLASYATRNKVMMPRGVQCSELHTSQARQRLLDMIRSSPPSPVTTTPTTITNIITRNSSPLYSNDEYQIEKREQGDRQQWRLKTLVLHLTIAGTTELEIFATHFPFLTSLVLNGLQIGTLDLRSLKLHTFDLREDPSVSTIQESSGHHHFFRDLCQTLVKCCPKIEAWDLCLSPDPTMPTYLSTSLQVLQDQEDVNVWTDSFPNLTSLAIDKDNFLDISLFTKVLKFYTNNLTRLELTTSLRSPRTTPINAVNAFATDPAAEAAKILFLQALHQFLCEAVQLKHFIAPEAGFCAEFLDMDWVEDDDEDDSEGSLAAVTSLSSRSSSQQPPPRRPPEKKYLDLDPKTRRARRIVWESGFVYELIQKFDRTQNWACRNLETLHLGLTTYSRKIGGRGRSDHIPASRPHKSRARNGAQGGKGDNLAGDGDQEAILASRNMFGYIAAHCPRLKKLHLIRSNVQLTVAGGLCLLARLQDLEVLVIEDAMKEKCDREPRNFAWIGHNEPQSSLDFSSTTIQWPLEHVSMSLMVDTRVELLDSAAVQEINKNGGKGNHHGCLDSRKADQRHEQSKSHAPATHKISTIRRFKDLWKRIPRAHVDSTTSVTATTRTTAGSSSITMERKPPYESAAYPMVGESHHQQQQKTAVSDSSGTCSGSGSNYSDWNTYMPSPEVARVYAADDERFKKRFQSHLGPYYASSLGQTTESRRGQLLLPQRPSPFKPGAVAAAVDHYPCWPVMRTMILWCNLSEPKLGRFQQDHKLWKYLQELRPDINFTVKSAH
ncbi:hypothetical protein BGZ83_000711 [Gryganskiella cystojenkinii]|nr:hypothetical protein BGZ83_000711 [Gryganskiella cystojenkinii]